MVMQRARRLFVLIAVVLLTVALPGFAGAAPAQPANKQPKPKPTEHRTITVFAVDQVPLLDINALGVLTCQLDGNADGFTVYWTFWGTTDGKLASASGRGSGSMDDHSLSVTLTSVSSWNMPGFPQPTLPKTGVVEGVSRTVARVAVSDPTHGTIVTGVPIRVYPRIYDLFHGPSYLAESSIGTGSVTLKSLPGAKQNTVASFARLP